MSRVERKESDKYLGDGVYLQPSSWEKGGWWIYTHNGIRTEDEVYLEPAALARLLALTKPSE